MAATCVLSLTALVITPLPALPKLLGCLAVLALVYRRATDPYRQAIIEHDSDAEIWTVAAWHRTPVTGKLVFAGYRSATMVVLAIQTEDYRCHRLAVWQDQLPTDCFSYLHFQLQFNTQRSASRIFTRVFKHGEKVTAARQQR